MSDPPTNESERESPLMILKMSYFYIPVFEAKLKVHIPFFDFA